MFSGTWAAEDRSLAALSEDPGEYRVRSYFRWSSEEEDELRRAVEKFGRKDWELMRRCPDFKLLRYRSATMLKNKWYKLMRSERNEESQSINSFSMDTSDGPTQYAKSFGGLYPVTPRKRVARYLSADLDTSIDSVHGEVPEGVQQPKLEEATQQLNDALATLREALAIQVDANKAAAASVAARDDGNGDDETVRTAMYVATLAQQKAKRARHHVCEAKQQHAAAVAADATDTASELLDVSNGFGGFELGSQQMIHSASQPSLSSAVEDSFHAGVSQPHQMGICGELAMLFDKIADAEAQSNQYINLEPHAQHIPQAMPCSIAGNQLPYHLRLSPPPTPHGKECVQASDVHNSMAIAFDDILPWDESAPSCPRDHNDPSTTGDIQTDAQMPDRRQSIAGTEMFDEHTVDIDLGDLATAGCLNGDVKQPATEHQWATTGPSRQPSTQNSSLGYGFCHGFWEMDLTSTTTTIPQTEAGFMKYLVQ